MVKVSGVKFLAADIVAVAGADILVSFRAEEGCECPCGRPYRCTHIYIYQCMCMCDRCGPCVCVNRKRQPHMESIYPWFPRVRFSVCLPRG